MLCFVVVMQSFIMNSHEVFIHINQGCFAGTGAIVRLPQCQWSKPDGYGKISQCITTTKHSKAKTVCIFLGIYCMLHRMRQISFIRQLSHDTNESSANKLNPHFISAIIHICVIRQCVICWSLKSIGVPLCLVAFLTEKWFYFILFSPHLKITNIK